jgi:hypothetical protein
MQRYGETLLGTERHCQHDSRGAPQGQSKQQVNCGARKCASMLSSIGRDWQDKWWWPAQMKAATRWNFLEGLLKSHIDCIEAIRQVNSSHPERDISDKTTSRDFVKKIMKHLPYLIHLKSASVSMQKRMASLEEYQFHCDLVASCASNGYGKAGNDFHYCK